MRVIIAAAGGQAKWGGFLGVPSHLAPVGGEPLLARTVRQALTISEDVHVTVPADPRYRAPGAVRHLRTTPYASEYDSTRDLWSETDRTVLLYGDVYFSPRAIETIARCSAPTYRCFGRYRGSKVTRCPYGEVFAASWHPGDHARLDSYLSMIADMRARGETNRPTAWLLLRAMQGTPLARHRVARPWFVEIDDETDDFDFPADYERHPATRDTAWAGS